MKLINHYNRDENDYEILSYQDVKSGLPSHVLFVSHQGDVKHAKITSIRSWKTRPEIRIGLKYGLYEYGDTTIFPDNHYSNVQLVKEV